MMAADGHAGIAGRRAEQAQSAYLAEPGTATLLERLRRHAPFPGLALAATADLATLLFARCLVEGGLSRLRAAVARHEDVLRRCPDGFAVRPVLLDGAGQRAGGAGPAGPDRRG